LKKGVRAPLTFKRNDQMFDILPIGVMVFPGIGIGIGSFCWLLFTLAV
jgi:hypothetical protein